MTNQENTQYTSTNAMYDHTDKNAELVRFLLKQDDDIQEKLMSFRGFKYDYEKNKYVQVSKPLLNNEGLEYVDRAFRRFLNKNSATANLKDTQVSQLVISFGSELRKNMLDNMFRYNITNTSTIEEVKNNICDQAWVLLTQSIQDKTRGFIFNNLKLSEVKSLAQQSPDKNKAIGW